MSKEQYICNDCGDVFYEDELCCETHYESRGEFWGAPCREKVYVYSCPICGSQDVEPYTEPEDYLDEDEF